MIKVDHVTKKYGQQKALDDISFSVAKGEIIGFLGPNGAGKSTMMKILTGSLKQDEGSMMVANIPVSSERTDFKYKVGYLAEHNPLYSDMYIREYLRFVAGFYKIPNVKERIELLISMTGLSPESHKKIAALSKGYRQRVGLAQALLADPEVLILDEPTTGLDPNQIAEVRTLIKNLGKQKTVMLSTHIMQEVQAICERVIIIDKGKIVLDAPVDAVQAYGNQAFVIDVEFEKTLDICLLEAIPNVTEVEHMKGQCYRLTAKTDVRRAISQMAANEELLLLSMRLDEKSLEQVFRDLTH